MSTENEFFFFSNTDIDPLSLFECFDREIVLTISDSNITHSRLGEIKTVEKREDQTLLDLVRSLHKTTRYRAKIKRESKLFVILLVNEMILTETDRIKRLLALKILMSKHSNIEFIFIGLSDELVSFGQELGCDYNFRYDKDDTPKVLFELTKPISCQSEIDSLVDSFAKSVISDSIETTIRDTSDTTKNRDREE